MAGHVVNPSTKFEDPTTIRSWVMNLWVLTSPIGYHWQCVCSHCACAVSRDLCVGGKFFPHIWNPWPRFAYLLYNCCGATMTFKVRLLFAPLVLKLFFGRKFLSTIIIEPQNGGFRGNGGADVKVWFWDPQKAHSCTEPRLLTYFASMSVVASWL